VTRLIRAVAADHGLNVRDSLVNSPLTGDGLRFVHKLIGPRFIAVGDVVAVPKAFAPDWREVARRDRRSIASACRNGRDATLRG
jgi:hypothetical protein